MYHHIPVLLQQAITILNPEPGQNFIDGTLGGGGYTSELLKHNQPGGKVLSIDLDQHALENFREQNSELVNSKTVQLAHGNFQDIDRIIEKHQFSNIAGIVADIGLSSYQLDQSGRGITFQKKELLDMRFDISNNNQADARFLLNNSSLEDLVAIFSNYGEEKYSRQIAKRVVETRAVKQFHYTDELVEVIKLGLPKPFAHRWADSARRIFQALRIAVNHELASLETFLPKALDLVAPGGKIVIVSFHSLEDRIVKQYFKKLVDGCVCPKDFPMCQCGFTPKVKLLTKKAIVADSTELRENSRSASAKLRAVQKL